MRDHADSRRLRVLVVMTRLPFPTDTGAKTRTHNLIRELGTRHDLWLVALALDHDAALARAEMQKYCREVIAIPAFRSSGKTRLVTEVAGNLFSSAPLTVARYGNRPLGRMVKEMVLSLRPQVIHCDSLQASINVPDNLGVPLVLTEHNVEWVIWEQYAQQTRNPAVRLALIHQARKMRRYEMATCRRFGRVVAMSEADESILRRIPGVADVSVVPNGVDCEYFRPKGSAARPKRLLFTGSMDWIPNADAACFFVKDIFPWIVRQIPDVEFWIVGRAPRPEVAALAGWDRRVVVTGAVPDIRRFLDEAAVVVAPLRIGSGTRLKIIEAMAMGKAVVSTTVGCEGLLVRPGEHLLVADEPEAFARETAALLRDPGRCARLGAAARRLAMAEYAWPLVAKRLEFAWRRTAARSVVS